MAVGSIKVGILEDQQVFLESLVSICENAGFEVVATGSTLEDFMASTRQHPPDVALVDLRLERVQDAVVTDGVRAVELLHDFFPAVKPLVLSGSHDTEVMERCFRAGAAGYLCKLKVTCVELVDAVTRVAQGESMRPLDLFSARVEVSEAVDATGVRLLTPRQFEVLRYISTGADNLKIAACLNITERTVKAHITSIYQKLKVENRTQMAMLACQLGLERPAFD
ncbi:response regulator transcription factor [Stigmatella aurantiaca]|uniref:Response regulator n=1 Tax=Stigmatella aurantiaca (strain DW4/3-1) TaxID=378806 RepID=Q08VW7_STIAD|nr:response regulator transcription factor [Stigmatella aurantiaca]ADO75316.1 Response regulator [Stigmatella aurantiaca DW4/3-1]EAU64629.1 response regulator [Stigmatella aurantiaca DW4/3-1]